MCGLNLMQTITTKIKTIQLKEWNMQVVASCPWVTFILRIWASYKNPTKLILLNKQNPTCLKKMEQICQEEWIKVIPNEYAKQLGTDTNRLTAKVVYVKY